ncbi:MAG: hypothetical protein AAF907_02815 [Planctomycetota bacterium]
MTLAPALAFFTVATADGSLDAAEIGRFRTQLDAGGAYGPTFSSALKRLSENADTLDAATTAAGEAALGDEANVAWAAIREALADQPKADRSRFAADVLVFARGIAEAAGGLYDVGPKVSESERAALAGIATALGAE